MSEPFTQSALFKGSNVSEIKEIKPNWILAQAEQKILVLHHWKMIKDISLWGPMDAQRLSFISLPGLDHETYPLILARSEKEISLLNLKLETMESMINTNIVDTTTPKGTFVVFKTSAD